MKLLLLFLLPIYLFSSSYVPTVENISDTAVNQILGSSPEASKIWSLVDEDCNFNKDMVFQDSMTDFTKMQQQLLDGLKNTMFNSMAGILGEGINGMLGDFTGVLSNIDVMCEIQAYKMCSVNHLKYLNNDKVNAQMSACVSKELKGSVEYKTHTETGMVWVGCWVPPGTPGAHYPPTYPLMANESKTVLKCWCGKFPCPVGTPRLIPKSYGESGMTMDPWAMTSRGLCVGEVYKENVGKRFERCLEQENKDCKRGLHKKTANRVAISKEKHHLNQEKCLIEKDALTKEFKDIVNQQLEGTLFPNNKKIVNSELISLSDDINVKKRLAFELTEQDIDTITVSFIEKCNVDLMSLEENKDKQKKLYDWCRSYVEEQNKDLWFSSELDNTLYEKDKIIIDKKYYLLLLLDNQRKDRMKIKYSYYRKHDKDKIVQYSEEAPEVLDIFKSELNFYDENFKSEYTKYDYKFKTLEDKMINFKE